MKNNLKNIIVTAVATLGFVAVAHTEVSADTITVQSGDTLWELANTYGTSIKTIQEDNNLANANLIIAGEKLIVNPTSSEKVANVSAPVATQEPQVPVEPQVQVQVQETGSVHDQFISAGGTEAMWSAIVLPESGGDVNASNGQYHGLGQTNQSWGYGSVAEQTQGMLQYAQERYNGIDGAIAFRESHNFW